jgi:hypothetical protein
MTVSAHETNSRCDACGSLLPEQAVYCPGCGRPIEGDVDVGVPPTETGPVPVTVARVEPRWFGVPSAALAVFAFALGRWPVGLILTGIGVLLFSAFLEFARRKPDSDLSRRSLERVENTRARAGSVLEALAVRTGAGRNAAVLRLELRRLQQRRRALLAAFGEAVYRGAEAEGLRGELEALDEQARTLDQELLALAINARDRIQQARVAVQPTQMVEVPEPYPPPDEGNPPTPPLLPEPEPPPDELTPPEPDPVPTPGPQPAPERDSEAQPGGRRRAG